MAELQAVQQRLQQVDRQLAAIEAQVVEARRAHQTLEGLTSDQPGLVPIGGGFHVRATLHGDQPVVVPVGSGYAADHDVASAAGLLKQRAEDAMDLLRRTEQEADKLAATAQQLAQKIQSESSDSDA